MNAIGTIKYIVTHLEGTSYEPWVNGVLFMLFFAAIVRAFSYLIGSHGRKIVISTITGALNSLRVHNDKGFGPEWESFRRRIEPFVSFASDMYFALVGLYSGLVVGIAFVLAMFNTKNGVPWEAVVVTIVWVFVSFFYMRMNLISASWSYHRIKTGTH